MISHRQCMSPRESVEPMYMPGTLADRLETFQDGEVSGVVVSVVGHGCRTPQNVGTTLPTIVCGPVSFADAGRQ